MPFSSLLCAGLIKIKLLKVLPSSPQIFNIPEYADSITFLDNLFQCLSTFMLKRFLLIPKQNFYCCWRDLLCLLLVLCISEKSLVMSCLYPTIRQLKIATRFRKGLRKPVSLILIHHVLSHSSWLFSTGLAAVCQSLSYLQFKMNAVLQMWSDESWIDRKNQFPLPAGSYLANSLWGWSLPLQGHTRLFFNLLTPTKTLQSFSVKLPSSQLISACSGSWD